VDQGFETWFALPDSVIMRPEVDTAFFFETEFQGQRHPHYGRFLQLEEDRLISLTWLNAALDGAETIVTVRLEPMGSRDRRSGVCLRYLRIVDVAADRAAGAAGVGQHRTRHAGI
jgi:uncharacterized protein YndB with AHSA1/START domain